MAFEEKRAWISGVIAVVGYAIYLAVVSARVDGGPLVEVAYEAALLWTVGSGIVAAIVLEMVVAMTSGRETKRKDQRDREIGRFGEYVGQSFVVIGGLAALVLAMVEASHFWIANAVFLAFVLSAALGAVAKIAAYRRGLPAW
ncbi:hypothetical protein ACWEFL_15320 [Streptomyces sp. NPDC004838]